MDLNAVLAIVAAGSSVLTMIFVQLKASRIKELEVCGHCLKIKQGSTKDSGSLDSPV